MNLWKLVIASYNGVELLKWGIRFRVQMTGGVDPMEYENMHLASLDFERRVFGR